MYRYSAFPDNKATPLFQMPYASGGLSTDETRGAWRMR